MTLKLADFNNLEVVILTRYSEELGDRMFVPAYRDGERIHTMTKVGVTRTTASAKWTIEEINKLGLEFFDPHKAFGQMFPKLDLGQKAVFETKPGTKIILELVRTIPEKVYQFVGFDSVTFGDTAHPQYTEEEMRKWHFRFVRILEEDRFQVIKEGMFWRAFDTTDPADSATFRGKNAKKDAEEYCKMKNEEISK